jgi:hypothetical protein
VNKVERDNCVTKLRKLDGAQDVITEIAYENITLTRVSCEAMIFYKNMADVSVKYFFFCEIKYILSTFLIGSHIITKNSCVYFANNNQAIPENSETRFMDRYLFPFLRLNGGPADLTYGM